MMSIEKARYLLGHHILLLVPGNCPLKPYGHLLESHESLLGLFRFWSRAIKASHRTIELSSDALP